MKYYHMILGSAFLFFVQWLFQTVFNVPLPLVVRILFLVMQAVIFSSYAVLYLAAFLVRRRHRKMVRRQARTMSNQKTAI